MSSARAASTTSSRSERPPERPKGVEGWAIVRRQPIYEKDRMDPVEPSRRLMLDVTVLAKFPEGYRHLAYLQTKNGFTVKGNLPGLRGPGRPDALRRRTRMARRLTDGGSSVVMQDAKCKMHTESCGTRVSFAFCLLHFESTMNTRTLGPFTVSEIGLGCMSLSWAYGVAARTDAAATLLLKALDLGYTHIDTAALYGFGANETLIGRVLKGRRKDFVLASKGGMFRNAGTARDRRPSRIHPASLRREPLAAADGCIDLYYLHRWDKRVPVEDSVGALSELVREGKVKTIGLSEVSAATIRKAHRVHPDRRRPNRYSLWTRNPEVAVLAPARTGHHLRRLQSTRSRLPHRQAARHIGDAAKDIRLGMPRFQPDHFRRICSCSTGWPRSRGNTAVPWASSRWPGCWLKATTSSRFLARRGSIIWKRT